MRYRYRAVAHGYVGPEKGTYKEARFRAEDMAITGYTSVAVERIWRSAYGESDTTWTSPPHVKPEWVLS